MHTCAHVHVNTLLPAGKHLSWVCATGCVAPAWSLPTVSRLRVCSRPGSLSCRNSCRQRRLRCTHQEPLGSTSSTTLRWESLRLHAGCRVSWRCSQSPYQKPSSRPPGPWWSRLWTSATFTCLCWAQGKNLFIYLLVHPHFISFSPVICLNPWRCSLSKSPSAYGCCRLFMFKA